MADFSGEHTPALSDSERAAITALTAVIDPEIGMNIVDLGLIYELTVQNDRVYARITMTTQGSPMHESICNAAERALQQAFPGNDVNVHLVWEPVWTPDRLSAATKERLGFPG